MTALLNQLPFLAEPTLFSSLGFIALTANRFFGFPAEIPAFR
jgi:hypothetical protein